MGYGLNLKNILVEKNMTVKDLANLTNISPSTLYSIIQRDSAVRYDYALRIANILDIDVDLICKDNPYREDPDLPPLLTEAGGLLTKLNKKSFKKNILDELLNLYEYKDFPSMYRMLVLFFQLNDIGREQAIDLLEALKLRQTDSERKELLKNIKELK
ncbi:MAG: helix-turn-helix transcriptional regulator [Lachnospiraceae bacterium]|nr:helix-turn-helix transcriptional regulator [Lachnospiraceae bacterium]MDO4966916.1 helix-turn-helix transcriptional regulator [Lachnospiraceae bacterium]